MSDNLKFLNFSWFISQILFPGKLSSGTAIYLCCQPCRLGKRLHIRSKLSKTHKRDSRTSQQGGLPRFTPPTGGLVSVALKQSQFSACIPIFTESLAPDGRKPWTEPGSPAFCCLDFPPRVKHGAAVKQADIIILYTRPCKKYSVKV